MSKFSSDAAEILYDLSMDGSWEETGDVETTGHVIFMPVSEDLRAQHPALTAEAYLLLTDSEGFVDAEEYASEADAEIAFALRAAEEDMQGNEEEEGY
jgi:hypothetical protein